MIASFMFTKYKLPIIRKIQSPFAYFLYLLFSSSRQAVLPANADGKPFLWNTSGYAVITMHIAATGILLSLRIRFTKPGSLSRARAICTASKPLSSTSSILARDTSPPTYINTHLQLCTELQGVFQEIGLF